MEFYLERGCFEPDDQLTVGLVQLFGQQLPDCAHRVHGRHPAGDVAAHSASTKVNDEDAGDATASSGDSEKVQR